MVKQGYSIGIDTGGTYTDAVLVHRHARKVISSAKALTTRGNLTLGIIDALQQIFAQKPADIPLAAIDFVSLSTTLATNAVVEGHGARVATILVGFDAQMVARSGIQQAFPQAPLIVLNGGHDHEGQEKSPLDMATLDEKLNEIGAEVSAFAVASAFAVRNPAHELRLRDHIAQKFAKPVTISVELSSALNAPLRALTAVLNARLISRLTNLIQSVEEAMRQIELVCPLMIVKGNGSLALARSIVLFPIETVLSGPAASLIGAGWMTQAQNFIMADMGGTTTDIGILEQAMPRVVADGAMVGGWRTMVKAIDITTIGLGGDSEVHSLTDGTLRLGPQRVIPLALLGQKFPEVVLQLENEVQASKIHAYSGQFVLRAFGYSNHENVEGLSHAEQTLWQEIRVEPKLMQDIANTLAKRRVLTQLALRGIIQFAGFTPSDAAHVLGLQHNWLVEPAQLGAKLFYKRRAMRQGTIEDIARFCREVWQLVVAQSCLTILQAATGERLNENILAKTVTTNHSKLGLVRVRLSPVVPVIAVGGPAPVYYAEVGEKLHTQVIFPAHGAVANAVGAAVGQIYTESNLTIETDGKGIFRVCGIAHSSTEAKIFQDIDQAVSYAEIEAHEFAKNLAIAQGGVDVQVNVQTRVDRLPGRTDGGGIISAHIEARAQASPCKRKLAQASPCKRKLA